MMELAAELHDLAALDFTPGGARGAGCRMRDFELADGGPVAVKAAIEDLVALTIQCLEFNYSYRVELVVFEWDAEASTLSARYTNHDRDFEAHDRFRLRISQWAHELEEIETESRDAWMRETTHRVRDWMRGMFKGLPYASCKEGIRVMYGLQFAFARCPDTDWMELL